MNTNSNYITGSEIYFQGVPHILRSVDFVTNKATIETKREAFVWPPEFKTVSMIGHKHDLDLATFREVLRAKVDFVRPRATKTGKFKLSKTLLTRLENQLASV